MTEPAVLEPPTVLLSTPTQVGPLADLILVRLLPPTKTRPAPKKLREEVGRLFPRPITADTFTETLSGLRAVGLMTRKGQYLTEAGRLQAMRYLGVEALPTRCDWGTIQSKYLVSKALGLSPTSPEVAKVIGNKDKFAAMLLKRKLALPVGTATTLNGVFEAIVCREVGFPDCTNLSALATAVLSKKLGDEKRRTREELKASAPNALLETTRPGLSGLRAVALADLFATSEEPVLPVRTSITEPFDLEAFANTVQAVARTCPTGRFGENKVFINNVWRQLHDQPQIAPLGLDGFKAKLVEANHQRLLTLSRADLVQMMDPRDVRESETNYLGAVFHFVLIEGA